MTRIDVIRFLFSIGQPQFAICWLAILWSLINVLKLVDFVYFYYIPPRAGKNIPPFSAVRNFVMMYL